MPENKELKIHRVFLFLFTFYIEVLTSQNRFFPIFFISEVPLPEGSSAFSIGNLNGDNFYDIVVSSRRAITCLENDGKRGFNFYFSIPVKEAPADVKLNDIDNDGVSEIIAVYRARSTVEIFKKDTLGFKKFISLEAGIYPDMFICSDIDLNGFKDVITVGKIMLGIAVNYQIKLNQFSNPVNLFPKTPFKRVKIQDLNYDDVPDLVGIDWLNNLLIISYGRGDGRFGLTYNYKLPEEPNDFAVADLNNDGFFDYVISFYYLDEVQFYYTTQAGINLKFKFKGQKPSKISIGDFNGDGLKDVVVSNGEKLFVFINSGAGFERYEFLSDGTLQVECADLDGNGKEEIVALDPVRNKFRIFYSGDGFQMFENYWLAVGLSSFDFVVGDFDRDDYVDFATVGDSSGFFLIYSGNNKFSLFPNQGNGLFTDVKFLSFSNFNYLFCSNHETGDVSLFRFRGREKPKEIFKYNFDRPKPVFMGLSNNREIAVFLTISDSNLILIKPRGYTEFDEVNIEEIDSTKIISLAVADFNNDGFFDIAIINWDGSNVKFNIFSRKKEGEYVKDYSVNLNRLIRRSFLYVDDFNSDGYRDILVYYDYSTGKISDGELNLFVNDGTGKFKTRKKINTHIHLSTHRLLRVADFTGDFKKDFVVFDKLRNKLYLYVSREEGFEKKQIYSSGDKINSINVADVNYDGYPDLILLNGTNGGLGFLINKNGEFK